MFINNAPQVYNAPRFKDWFKEKWLSSVVEGRSGLLRTAPAFLCVPDTVLSPSHSSSH